MFYVVYKITNRINGKIYIGCHKTTDIDDNYMGSGTILAQALRKYGKPAFNKEILVVCKSSDEMFNTEANLVNEEFIARSDTYNIKLGGTGGWDHVNGKMSKKQTDQRISNYKKSMTVGKQRARSKKLKDTWANKNQDEKKQHSRKVKQGVSKRDELKRIENYKKTMNKRTEEQEQKRRQLISENGNAKMWEITSPKGEVFVIKSLKRFCEEHNLNMHAMYNSAAGHKQFKNPGWSCRRQ